MSEFDKLHEHLKECVDSDNDSFVGITEDGVEFNMYEFAFGLSVKAKREHEMLVEENNRLKLDKELIISASHDKNIELMEENARLIELCAEKADRCDELYEVLVDIVETASEQAYQRAVALVEKSKET